MEKIKEISLMEICDNNSIIETNKKMEENNSMFYGVISSLKLFQNKLLFAGIGNFLGVYNIEGKENLIKKIRIFESEKISKINIYKYDDNKTFLLILSGETKIKYSFFNENEFNFIFNEIITKSHDYIMDQFYYSSNDNKSENKYLIIGFINNFIEIYKFNDINNKFEFIKYIFSSTKCIVYSMAFNNIINNDNINQNDDCILIASGTVFRKVIIWQINYIKSKQKFIKDEKNILELTGHKGVIFSVHFYSNNTLSSTSDDRITKYWKFDLKNKIFTSEDYTGHSSRVWDSKIYEPKNILVTVSEDATALLYDLNLKKCKGKLNNGHEGWNIRSVEMNQDFVWTGGEDGRLLKWKYTHDNNNNDKIINNSEKNEIIIKIENKGEQYDLACQKQKQKNFKCSIKVVKFVNEKIVILGTNHGQILGYMFNKISEENNNKNIIYEDKEARVINSIDIIKEYNLIIVGLNDGTIAIISYIDINSLHKNNNYKSYLIKIFNERVTFISHKILDENKLFLIFSSEKSKTKICLINNFIPSYAIKIIENEFSFLYFISPFESQINTFEIKPINNDNNNYLLFFGDCEGKIIFTQIKNISNHLYLFSNLLKYIQIFKKSIITSIIYSLNQKILFVHSRNNKFKKYVITNEETHFFSLKEIESQSNQAISSYEKILYKDSKSFEEEKYFIIGHNGRDLIIYDNFLKKIIHKNDVKGVNKPLDLYLDYKNNKIFYISGASEVSKIFSIKIESNDSYIKENNNDNLLISNSYCLPVNGRVIHDIGFLYLNNDKYLLFTAGEDTKIKFYYINNIKNIFDLNVIDNENKSIIHLADFKMHDCAVRKIIFISQLNNDYYFCSIGAKKEIFIFKLNLDDINKPKFICLENISENKNNSKEKPKNKIEINVENSRNMDLCILNLQNNNFQISITDTIDETSIFNFKLINEKDTNINISKKSIKFTSSNFIPLCICYCTEEYLLYGQSNGILRVYNYKNKNEAFFKMHEGGINEIKIKESLNDENIYLIFTCGEDCTLVISEFNAIKNKIDIINKIKNIHFSAIKSIDIIESSNEKELYIITGGYDQIVSVSKFNKPDYSFKNLKIYHACVSEINSIKGIITKNEHKENFLYISIGGLGIEFIKHKI